MEWTLDTDIHKELYNLDIFQDKKQNTENYEGYPKRGEDMTRSSIGTTEEERSRPQSPVVECPDDVARFGIAPPTTAEQRLLSKIMRDMCYVAGRLLQTAAKILNKALQLSCIPQDIFEEALRRTMQVINGARDEIVRIICPKQPEKFLLPSEKAPAEIILEATQIVDSILLTAKERIAVVREKYPGNMADQKIPRIVFESDIHVEAKEIVAEVIDEAYRKVVQTIVLDFLTDLISQAENEADLRSEDVNSGNVDL